MCKPLRKHLGSAPCSELGMFCQALLEYCLWWRHGCPEFVVQVSIVKRFAFAVAWGIEACTGKVGVPVLQSMSRGGVGKVTVLRLPYPG